MYRRVSKIFTIFSVAAALLIPGWAADPASPAAPSTPAAASPSDIAKLKAQLDEQQKVIEQLRFALEEQRKMIEKAGFAAAKAQPVAEKPLIDLLNAQRETLAARTALSRAKASQVVLRYRLLSLIGQAPPRVAD